MEEAIRDGDSLPEIQELKTKWDNIVDEVANKILHSKDKNLDKLTKKAQDCVRKAMEDARTKLINKKLTGLASHLEKAAAYKGGSWTYRPSKSSRDWRT